MGKHMNQRKIFDVSEKVVIITGAAGFLGTQYSKALSQHGANVVLADINYSKCKQLANELKKKFHVKPLPIKVDISNKKSVKEMVSKVIKNYSKIDVLVNNASYVEGKATRLVPFEKLSIENWNKVISVNITGVFLCTQEVGRIMMKQKRGIIINISSIYGLVAPDQRIYGKSGLNSSIVYGITKGAVLNLTRYLASNWSKHDIRINSLTLGGVENDHNSNFIKNYSYRTMIGRMAKPNEYVGALLFFGF